MKSKRRKLKKAMQHESSTDFQILFEALGQAQDPNAKIFLEIDQIDQEIGQIQKALAGDESNDLVATLTRAS